MIVLVVILTFVQVLLHALLQCSFRSGCLCLGTSLFCLSVEAIFIWHSLNQKVQTKKALTGLSSLVLEAELAVTFKMLCAPC